MVVVASLARNRSSLAIGNIIGSVIANILGAFSLGLLFYAKEVDIKFDRSSRLYSLLLLLLTAVATIFTFVGTKRAWRAFGGVLIAAFIVYVVSITWAISHGAISAPELSDSDSDSNSGADSDSDSVAEDGRAPKAHSRVARIRPSQNGETAPLLAQDSGASDVLSDSSKSRSHRARPLKHGLIYHILFLLLGFLAISLSGYVLSHASSTISDETGISDVLFGVIILSIATTLPEKFVAVISGARGQPGILVANTVGSNIFLLTLCLGIVFLASGGDYDKGSVNAAELGVMVASTVALTATVWVGARWSRWIGGGMLGAYGVFLILEFTVIRNV